MPRGCPSAGGRPVLPACRAFPAVATEEELGGEGLVTTLEGTLHIIFFSHTSLNLAFNYVLMMLAAFSTKGWSLLQCL